MSISLSNFTQKSEEVLLLSQELAHSMKHYRVEPEHLLYLVLQQTGHPIQACFEQFNFNPLAIQEQLHIYLQSLDCAETEIEQAYISRTLHGIIVRAEKEALLLSKEYTHVEHLFLGLVGHQEGYLGQVWEQFSISVEAVRDLLLGLSPAEQAMLQRQQDFALSTYCVDLLELARANQLDPLIGKEKEIRMLIQVLSRRVKNNPLLLGESGVGKTAIVEGLAQRIAKEDVPDWLKNRRLLSLDLATLLAGTTYRGEFEKRMKQLIEEVEHSHGEVILFIDELHMLVGAGGVEGGVDAANMLKPSLARGKMRCIGATTIKEFRLYLEKDSALVRRFEQILLQEPDKVTTIAILRGLRSHYERHHGVTIKDSALVTAANLSERYLPERFLPDKAIDLVDEAAANLRIEMDSVPSEIDYMERQIIQLEMQRNSIRQENDPQTGSQYEEILQQLYELRDKNKEFRKRWKKERTLLQRIANVKEKIAETRQSEYNAQRKGDLELAARLHYETLDQLESELAEEEEELNTEEERLVKEEVDQEDIAAIVSIRTGIPVARMLADEKQKLVKMETHLAERIVGQPEALSRVASAIRRSRAGIQAPAKPIGSFVFMGSSGIGKTELALALAEFLFDHDKALIRFDMSEYMEKHSVTRLIGASPGYVGFEEGGLLTEQVRRQPYAVLLFDEIEKAHLDVFNLFLQILDDGNLTDSQGRQTDFRNTIIIMTTNIGHELAKSREFEHQESSDLQKQARQLLLQYFRPEFLNRLDEIILFKHLSLSHIRQICQLQLKQFKQQLALQHIQLELTENAEIHLAQRGYDATFGARPLKRTVQREMQDPIALKLLEGSLRPGETLRIDVEHNQLKLLIL